MSASADRLLVGDPIDRARWARYELCMRRVIAHVHGHLDEPFDLNGLADIALLSPHHWHRIYHAMYGETLARTGTRMLTQFFDDPGLVPEDSLRAQAAVAGCAKPGNDCGLVRTVAEAAWEALSNGAPIQSLTPVWRVLPADSATREKLSFDIGFVQRQRELEGLGAE